MLMLKVFSLLGTIIGKPSTIWAFFCFYYIDSPHNALYKKSARNFMKQLSFLHDYKECILLFFTGLLSKIELGRKGYHSLHKMYKTICG